MWGICANQSPDFVVFATHFTLYQPLSNFPDSDFHRRRQERPVMQDPAATYIEAKLGQEAVLPCFALGTPTPITRSVHMDFIVYFREYGNNREKYWSEFSPVMWVSGLDTHIIQ